MRLCTPTLEYMNGTDNNLELLAWVWVLRIDGISVNNGKVFSGYTSPK